MKQETIIKYNRFNLTLSLLEPALLPPYKGSTLRGGFGHAFKRVACAIKDKECINCLLKERCVYSYIFETPPPKETKMMRKYKAAPHPFVIEPPLENQMTYKPEEKITLSLVLIGKAVDYLPYFIYTFDELGKIGIGRFRAKFELKEVYCNGEIIYDSESRVIKSFKSHSLSLNEDAPSPKEEPLKLLFLTPTRIVYDERLTLGLEFHILIRALLRRLFLIYYFHCGGDPSGWDFKGMIEKAKEIETIGQDLRWYDWERYSKRQNTRMKMGGFVGEITFEGNLAPFISLIKAGEVLHVGKGTAFGLGRYKIIGSE